MINLYTNSTIGSYTTGTVSCTKNSATVTGTGTTWSEIVNPGDILTLNDDKLYVIKTVNSNTSITLDKVFAENTVSNSAYRIFLNTAAHFPSDTAAKVERALEQLSDINEAAINNDRTVTAATKVNGKGIESTTGYINLNPPSVNSNDGGSLRFHYNQSSSATSSIYEYENGKIKLVGDAAITGETILGGNASILGNLQFNGKVTNSNVYIKTPTFVRGSVNADLGSVENCFGVVDSNSKVCGRMDIVNRYVSDTDYNNKIEILVYDPKDNTVNGNRANIAVGYNQNGAYTYAPTPATSDNSTKIATTAYVKSNLSSYVDLSSIQNISGSKTFTNALTIKTRGSNAGSELIISNPDIVKGTVPSGTKYANIGFYGDAISSYSDRVGLVECQYNSDKSINVRLMAYNSTSSGNTNACAISCNVDSNGNIYTYAPTPDTNDNSTKIATTAFVNNAAVMKKAAYDISASLNSTNVLSGAIQGQACNGILSVYVYLNIADIDATTGWKNYNLGTINSPKPAIPVRFTLTAQDTGLSCSAVAGSDGNITMEQKGIKMAGHWVWGGFTVPVNV